jgi:hypothetical protein
MRRSCLPLLAFALAGCGSAQQQLQLQHQTNPQTYAQEKARYERSVGKGYWIASALRFCPVPNLINTKCQTLGDGYLKIDGIEHGITETPAGNLPSRERYYHVTLHDGRTGYILTADLMTHGAEIDPEMAAAECKRRGDPRVGMTASQVEATCWGKPGHVNRTHTADGISDQYVYGDGRYVDFRDGIVTSIQGPDTLR